VKYLWNTATLLIVIGWTVTIASVSYGRGYYNGQYDERVLQTQILLDLQTLVERKCR
jgi:hypothetical protein